MLVRRAERPGEEVLIVDIYREVILDNGSGFAVAAQGLGSTDSEVLQLTLRVTETALLFCQTYKFRFRLKWNSPESPV